MTHPDTVIKAKAVHEAVSAIYFADSSDYLPALWSIVRMLSPDLAEMLERDERLAWQTSDDRANAATPPAQAQGVEAVAWEKLSSNALDVMKSLGDFGPTVRAEDRMVKGYILCDGGDDGRTYYDSNDLRRIAEGCNEVADWLDHRAAHNAVEPVWRDIGPIYVCWPELRRHSSNGPRAHQCATDGQRSVRRCGGFL